MATRLPQVHLAANPWISGKRAKRYYGPVRSDSFVLYNADMYDAIDEATRLALTRLRRKARKVGGNWVVGLDVQIDLWAKDEKGEEGCACHCVGTAAELEPLF